MAKKLGSKASKQQLGSGIDALFGGGSKRVVDKAIAENTEDVVRELAKKFALIPVAEIERNPDQPRYEFDEEALEELAESIKIHGIIQFQALIIYRIDATHDIIKCTFYKSI